MNFLRLPWLVVSTLLSTSALAAAAVEHPFILWTRAEAAAIRQRVEKEPWAKKEYEVMLAAANPKGRKGGASGEVFVNLFQITVMGDEKVAEAEKAYLLSFIGSNPESSPGNPRATRHMDNYLNVLRYDALFDRLTAEERAKIEATFREHIDFYLHRDTPPSGAYTRTSWLPNMQWERPMSAHFEALAMGDEKLLRECIGAPGGWKWYFDEYIADGRFYSEEFGKQYSMNGEMLLFCRGLERAGLDALGYGFTGKGGATMRSYLESIYAVGWPRTELPGGLPHYGKVTMGDARGTHLNGAPPYAFQHAIVSGFLANGDGGNERFDAHNMNGRDHKGKLVDKMMTPLWFEMAQQKWPDAHFDYFLAQMRGPADAKYFPTLFFGLDPIDPNAVKPPPAPSYVARERGFAFLRAEESPAFWESSAPAVALQFATYYVHYAHDVFSLLGLHAFNRPIYLNRQISNGYGGGCPWTDSTRGVCGVMVDNLQFQLDHADPKQDHPHWPNPVGEVPTRSAFTPLVKYVAALAKPVGGKVTLDNRQPLAGSTLSLDLRREEPEVWPGVGMSRALFLTSEYLFDVLRLTSDQPHRYDWHVHALGLQKPDEAWKSTADLTLDRLYDMKNRALAAKLADPIEAERYQIKDARKLAASDGAWTATIEQTCALPDVAQSVLGQAWYDRRIGVRVRMLGEPGTTVYAGRSPESRQAPGKEKNKGEKSALPNEVGGTTLLVSRHAPGTVFAALHEPFEKGAPHIETFRRIEQNERGLAVAIAAPESGIDDRILYRFWPDFAEPLTLAGGGESFTFADRVFIRIRAGKVEAEGDLRVMKLKVPGQPKLILNGKETRATITSGVMEFAQ